MKKSKIIVPALAMIGLSAVASVTGSVAWFTAVRKADISAGNYTVVRTSAELASTLHPGVGTTVNGSTVTVGGKLTDGSFNHKTGNIFVPNSGGTGIASTVALSSIDLETPNSYKNLLRGTDASDSNKTIYTAITWDIDLTITFGVVDTGVALFLNLADTSFVADAQTATTALGFRTAIVPKPGYSIPTGSTERAMVYAGLQAENKCKYLTDATAASFTTPTAYNQSSDHDLVYSGYTADPLGDTIASTSLATRNDYLGTFKFQASTPVTLKYTVVAWYEGTDENIDNDATVFDTVTSTLSFKAVDITTAS